MKQFIIGLETKGHKINETQTVTAEGRVEAETKAVEESSFSNDVLEVDYVALLI